MHAILSPTLCTRSTSSLTRRCPDSHHLPQAQHATLPYLTSPLEAHARCAARITTRATNRMRGAHTGPPPRRRRLDRLLTRHENLLAIPTVTARRAPGRIPTTPNWAMLLSRRRTPQIKLISATIESGVLTGPSPCCAHLEDDAHHYWHRPPRRRSLSHHRPFLITLVGCAHTRTYSAQARPRLSEHAHARFANDHCAREQALPHPFPIAGTAFVAFSPARPLGPSIAALMPPILRPPRK
ncbi:hypothetical protein B0H19DRAFT_1257355 [Mycena capillaripes]|nr:hypothetical protein B0H19DRAFT_1257355 [Mycena capillaripes]